jgi:hypothetical protein
MLLVADDCRIALGDLLVVCHEAVIAVTATRVVIVAAIPRILLPIWEAQEYPGTLKRRPAQSIWHLPTSCESLGASIRTCYRTRRARTVSPSSVLIRRLSQATISVVGSQRALVIWSTASTIQTLPSSKITTRPLLATDSIQ